MTNQEAIEFLKNMIDREAIGFVCPEGEGDVAIWQYHVEALHMAISALEKQIPKKLIPEGGGYADGEMVYDIFYCPSCDHRMEEDEVEDYCPNCGQKICWEGE